MPTTTGVLFLRLSVAGKSAPSRATTGNFNLALRLLSGIFSDGEFQYNAQAKKTLLPRRDVPIADSNGMITEPWWRLFKEVYERKLGGDLAPTVPEVISNVSVTQDAITSVTAQQTAQAQVITANAATLAATVQTSQNAALPGASQIPPPVLEVPPPPPAPRRNQNNL